jgi:hypothetical protein
MHQSLLHEPAWLHYEVAKAQYTLPQEWALYSTIISQERSKQKDEAAKKKERDKQERKNQLDKKAERKEKEKKRTQKKEKNR